MAETVKLGINLNDIAEHIKSHREDKNIKYLEVLFMQYMKENYFQAKETLPMLIYKYNLLILPMDQLKSTMDSIHSSLTKEKSFEDYLSSVQNLDVSGICDILFPTLKLHGVEGSFYQGYEQVVKQVIEELKISDSDDIAPILDNAILNYVLVNQLEEIAFLEKDISSIFYKIKVGKNHCYGMLHAYEDIYGKDKVDEVRKVIQKIIV